ncbi:MAG: hypothetical protein QOH72_1814 [Solirubrobacteraceae bacterium]|jgi:hypothetical protein|nr:hypothetical protein [Solirubrobacteraceae bacterium]
MMIHQFMYPKVTPVRPGTGTKPAAAPASSGAPRRAA